MKDNELLENVTLPKDILIILEKHPNPFELLQDYYLHKIESNVEHKDLFSEYSWEIVDRIYDHLLSLSPAQLQLNQLKHCFIYTFDACSKKEWDIMMMEKLYLSTNTMSFQMTLFGLQLLLQDHNYFTTKLEEKLSFVKKKYDDFVENKSNHNESNHQNICFEIIKSIALFLIGILSRSSSWNEDYSLIKIVKLDSNVLDHIIPFISYLIQISLAFKDIVQRQDLLFLLSSIIFAIYDYDLSGLLALYSIQTIEASHYLTKNQHASINTQTSNKKRFSNNFETSLLSTINQMDLLTPSFASYQCISWSYLTLEQIHNIHKYKSHYISPVHLSLLDISLLVFVYISNLTSLHSLNSLNWPQVYHPQYIATFSHISSIYLFQNTSTNIHEALFTWNYSILNQPLLVPKQMIFIPYLSSFSQEEIWNCDQLLIKTGVENEVLIQRVIQSLVTQSKDLMFLCQGVLSAIINCSNDNLRKESFRCFRLMIDSLEFGSKLTLINSLIEVCPFQPIKATLVDLLKSFLQEYFLNSCNQQESPLVVKKLPSQNNFQNELQYRFWKESSLSQLLDSEVQYIHNSLDSLDFSTFLWQKITTTNNYNNITPQISCIILIIKRFLCLEKYFKPSLIEILDSLEYYNAEINILLFIISRFLSALEILSRLAEGESPSTPFESLLIANYYQFIESSNLDTCQRTSIEELILLNYLINKWSVELHSIRSLNQTTLDHHLEFEMYLMNVNYLEDKLNQLVKYLNVNLK